VKEETLHKFTQYQYHPLPTGKSDAVTNKCGKTVFYNFIVRVPLASKMIFSY